MKVTARLNNYRSSASKVRLIAPVIKGLGAMEAQLQLDNLRKGCAEDVKKLIKSAVANAENNHGLDKSSLVVTEFVVEEGKTMKRWRPRAHGRAFQILKRTCDVIVVVEDLKAEKTEIKKGKGSKKTKDEKKSEKVAVSESKAGESTEEKPEDEKKNLKGKKDIFSSNKQKFSKQTEGQKIFRRKSF